MGLLLPRFRTETANPFLNRKRLTISALRECIGHLFTRLCVILITVIIDDIGDGLQ